MIEIATLIWGLVIFALTLRTYINIKESTKALEDAKATLEDAVSFQEGLDEREKELVEREKDLQADEAIAEHGNEGLDYYSQYMMDNPPSADQDPEPSYEVDTEGVEGSTPLSYKCRFNGSWSIQCNDDEPSTPTHCLGTEDCENPREVGSLCQGCYANLSESLSDR